MKYLKVIWMHDSSEDPIEYYSEIDSERWEHRKIEVFKDGSVAYSSDTVNSSELSEERIPEIEQIELDSQFQPSEISAEDFEAIWIKASRAPLSRLRVPNRTV